MDNYVEFSSCCDTLAHEITDCDFVAVKTLLMAASSLDVPSVVSDICKIVDLLTGCGFDFISSEVEKIHVQFFS